MIRGLVLIMLIGGGAWMLYRYWKRGQPEKWDWAIYDDGCDIHIYPTGDKQDHTADDDCICAPEFHECLMHNDSFRLIVTHHNNRGTR
jgi:hypothetical protein